MCLFSSVAKVLLAFALVFSCTATISRAVEVRFASSVGQNEKQLLSDCIIRYPEIVEWCGNLTMSVKVQGYLGPESKPRESVGYSLTVFSNGGEYFRVDEDGKRKARNDKGKDVSGKSILILRPEGLGKIGNTPTNARLLVENIQGNQEENIYRIMATGTPWCVHSVMGAPLKTFLAEPPPAFGNYLIESIEAIEEDGRSFIRVVASSNAGSADEVEYRFLIDKESGVLREFRIDDTKSKQANCGEVEYDFNGVQGTAIPSMKRYVSWAEVGNVKYNEVVYSVEKLTLGPAQLEVFDPSSLGLNVSFPKSRSSLTWLYLGLVGLLLIAVYIFGSRSRRK